MYDGRCTHTHLLHAYCSPHSACTVTFAHLHACAHARMAQVMSKRCLSHECLRSLSRLLPSHVPPVFAVLARPPRHHFPVHLLAELSRPKSEGHAQLGMSTENFGFVPTPVSRRQGQHPRLRQRVTSEHSSSNNISRSSRHSKITFQLSGNSVLPGKAEQECETIRNTPRK